MYKLCNTVKEIWDSLKKIHEGDESMEIWDSLKKIHEGHESIDT
jgi:hypothetical protein